MNESLLSLLGLSPQQLSRSAFYPACGSSWGIDLKPLVTFSHLTTTFIYSDYHRARPDEVLFAIHRKLSAMEPSLLPGSLRMVSASEPFSLPRSLLKMPDGLNEWEQAEFRQASREAIESPWAMHILFERVVAGQARRIRLCFLATEGLNLYDALFTSSGLAPAILCTVVSGAGSFGGGFTSFEDARGGALYRRLASATSPIPSLWTRGCYYLQGYTNSDVLAPCPLYPMIVAKNVGWDCDSLKTVSTFASDSWALRSLPREKFFAGPHRRITLSNRPLDLLSEGSQYDALFLPPNLALKAWGKLPRGRVTETSFDESTEAVLHRVWKHLEMLPPGRRRACLVSSSVVEDDGVSIAESVRLGGGEGQIDIRVAYPLDFIDVRLEGRAVMDLLTSPVRAPSALRYPASLKASQCVINE
ncbi:MAG: hypothetical protein ABFD92_03880 [Planctomycetaceae bacterium]|nr:hypothetical protein [Planctomycetaceae bacterium]